MIGYRRSDDMPSLPPFTRTLIEASDDETMPPPYLRQMGDVVA